VGLDLPDPTPEEMAVIQAEWAALRAERDAWHHPAFSDTPDFNRWLALNVLKWRDWRDTTFQDPQGRLRCLTNWMPSNSLEDAFVVLLHFRELGWGFELQTMPGHAWKCVASPPGHDITPLPSRPPCTGLGNTLPSRPPCTGLGNTLPEAICRVALTIHSLPGLPPT
jgi:hypothetical protein